MLPPQSLIWFGSPLSPPDGEGAGQPHPAALGDDNAGIDDEGGVQLGPILIPCQVNAVQVETSGPDGVIYAWIDFNDDGDWKDSSEHIFTNQLILTGGAHLLSFTVPCTARPTHVTFARFRISSGPTDYQDKNENSPPWGEVEDYAVAIQGPDLSITKIDDIDPAAAGDIVTYHLQIVNQDPVLEPSAVVTDIVPAGLTVISAQPGQGSCDILVEPLRCELGAITGSTIVTVSIATRVGGSAGSEVQSRCLSCAR